MYTHMHTCAAMWVIREDGHFVTSAVRKLSVKLRLKNCGTFGDVEMMIAVVREGVERGSIHALTQFRSSRIALWNESALSTVAVLLSFCRGALRCVDPTKRGGLRFCGLFPPRCRPLLLQ